VPRARRHRRGGVCAHPPRQATTAAVSRQSGSSGAGRGALNRATRGASPRHGRVGRGGASGGGRVEFGGCSRRAPEGAGRG